MGSTPNTNTASVTVTDRAAAGAQPDNTPATGSVTTGGGGGSGTVTSVGLAVPTSEFTAGGTPVTGSGTLTITKTNQSANLVWAGPQSGSAAQPTFRSLVVADVPAGGTPGGTAGGDLSGTYPNPSLAAIGSATGPIGSATTVPVVTTDTKGRVTALTSVTIAGTVPGGTAGGDLTGTYPNPTLVAIGGGAIGPIGSATTVPVVTRDAKGRVTALTSATITGTPPGGTAGGDLTGTYPNPMLAAIGSATGPVGDSSHVAAVTIDAKGRVTGLTSVAITASGGITPTLDDTPGITRYRYPAGLPAGSLSYRVTKEDVFNVRDYGAAGDGSTDDTAAINNAITAAYSAGVAVALYFPPGYYRVISTITIQPTRGADGQNWHIYGHGKNVSILQCDHANTGLVWSAAGTDYVVNPFLFTLYLHGVGVIANNQTTPYASATGLTVTYSHTQNGAAGQYVQPANYVVRIHDIQVAHYNTKNMYASGGSSNLFNPATGAALASNAVGWTNGIALNNVWNAQYFDIYIPANIDNYVFTPISAAGSGIAFLVNGGVTTETRRVTCLYWHTSAFTYQTSSPLTQSSQDISISECDIIDCVNSFTFISKSGGNGIGPIQIIGCQSSNTDYQYPGNAYQFSQEQIIVREQNGTVTNLFMSNCFMTQYCYNTILPAILLDGVCGAFIGGGCKFETHNNSTSAPLVHMINNCKSVTIEGCVMYSDSAHAIVDSGCSGITFSDNRAIDGSGNPMGCPTFTNNAGFGAVNNLDLKTYLVGKGTRAVLTVSGGYTPSGTGIPSGSEVPVYFSSATFDDLAQLVGLVQIYMPGPPTAVRRVTATFNARFDNSTGGTVRQIKIKDQSGTTYAEALLPPLVSPNGTTGMALSITTGELDVIASGITYLACYAYQDSGGALNLIANHTSFVVEYDLENA